MAFPIGQMGRGTNVGNIGEFVFAAKSRPQFICGNIHAPGGSVCLGLPLNADIAGRGG